MSTAASFPLPPESAPQPATSVSVAPEHLAYMRQALEAAEAATRRGEVPVGAVVVAGGTVLSVAHNERETGNDPTAHAEVLALRRAAAALGSWRLTEADLYVTMEPCPMCAGALLNAKVGHWVLGGRFKSVGRTDLGRYSVEAFAKFMDANVKVTTGILQTECEMLRSRFFQR